MQNTGDSYINAITVEAANEEEGVKKEYEILSGLYGVQNGDWKLVRQSLQEHEGKKYDVMKIQMKDGAEKEVFFDISGFFGK